MGISIPGRDKRVLFSTAQGQLYLHLLPPVNAYGIP
jgi:hypothetical protein